MEQVHGAIGGANGNGLLRDDRAGVEIESASRLVSMTLLDSGPTPESGFPETAAWKKYQELPKVGMISSPDAEKILVLKPDLILGNLLAKHWA